MSREIDVAIIGAGSAGLFAAGEVRKVTQNYILIDPGPYGSTCARTACMPSKLLIRAANDYYRRFELSAQGITGSESLKIDTKELLKYVRSMRDHFVSSVVKSLDTHSEHLVKEHARFISASRLKVGAQEVKAKKIVIATGSRPVIPKEFEEFKEFILTSETIFELKELPKRIAIFGVGVIGAELGQALARLGVQVTAFHIGQKIAGMTDPKVQDEVLRIFTSEFPIHIGLSTTLHRRDKFLVVKSDKGEVEVDAVLLSTGRRPNLDNLDFEKSGAVLNDRGIPKFNPSTMQVDNLPIFIAGDANGDRPILPEASDEGRIAGYNSVHTPRSFKRRTRLAIAFTSPNVAIIGLRFSDLKDIDFAIGEASFSDQGRAKIERENKGIIRVYGEKKAGKLLGAEMVAPGGEHLAHLLALAIEQGLTVFQLLRMPFYHPVLEQGLKNALRDLAKKINEKPSDFELQFCADEGIASIC